MVVEQGQLRRSLGVAGGWAVAASSTAATTSIGMGALASIVGVRLPIVLVLGFLPILGIAVAYSRLGDLSLVREQPLPFPPEPIRYASIQLTRWSHARADKADGRRNLWLRTLDRLGVGFDS